MKAVGSLRRVRSVLAAIVVGAGTLAARAAVSASGAALELFQTDVRNYNVISFGNSTFTNYGDTQGPLAINGNLALTGGVVAAQPSNFGLTSDPTLYVTGNLTLSGLTQLESGYAATPGLTRGWTWDPSQKTLSGGGGSLSSANSNAANAANNPVTNPAPANWNWSTLTSQMASISSTLASATVNGSITVNSQNLIFSGPANPANGIVVFTLDASELCGNSYNGQTISNVQINVPAGIDYVINVINASGTTIFGSGVNFNAGSNDSQILWNIEGGGTVTLGGGQFLGAVLAPSAVIDNGPNTAISGQIVADGFNDSGAETHFTEFVVGSVVVPESAGFAWGAVGLCGLGVWLRRRARPHRAGS